MGFDGYRGAAIVVIAVLVASPALAQPSAADKETARAQMERGHAAFDSGKYADALKPFQNGDAIMNLPTTALWVAKTLTKLGRLVEARQVALDIARLPVTPHETSAVTRARAEAAELARKLGPRIPSLTVNVDGVASGVAIDVTIDGAPVEGAAVGVARKLDPGKHVVLATARGYAGAKRETALAEGAAETLALTLSPDPAANDATPAVDPAATTTTPGGTTDHPATRSVSPLVYVGFGVGALGLIAGGITGGLALANASKAKDHCRGIHCDSGATDFIARSNTFADVSTVGLGVGLAGVAVGVVGLVLSSGHPNPPKAARWVRVGPGSLTLGGSF